MPWLLTFKDLIKYQNVIIFYDQKMYKGVQAKAQILFQWYLYDTFDERVI